MVSEHMMCLLQRYYYYIEKGIKKEMLAPQEGEEVKRIKSMIPEPLLTCGELQPLVEELTSEVDSDYEFSLRKAIGK